MLRPLKELDLERTMPETAFTRRQGKGNAKEMPPFLAAQYNLSCVKFPANELCLLRGYPFMREADKTVQHELGIHLSLKGVPAENNDCPSIPCLSNNSTQ